MFWVTVFVAFVICTCCNCIYYASLSMVFRKSVLQTEEFLEPVSIIIAAKNEAVNLSKHLPKILNQDYSKLEVIVVDDASTDATSAILQDFQLRYKALQVIRLDTSKGKKHALTRGIARATSKCLLFTDADCYPSTSLWVQSMSNHFASKKDIVLGYGSYKKTEGFLNTIIRFETLFTAFQYFGFAYLSHPYMGVGRNLAYKTSLFEKYDGFASHKDLLSGDDDLFVSKAASKHNTAICLDANAFTISEPKTTFKSWWLQKRRHLTTAPSYKLKHKLALGGFYLSSALFWVLLLILSFCSHFTLWIMLIATARIIICYSSLSKAAKRLKEDDLSRYAILLEIPLLFMQPCLFIANIVSKPTKWN